MTDFRKSTVYQIYPRSFYDTNGDGFGDLKGVTAKLDYIKELGVDYIWMTPFFVSPQYDNGYDVEDYYNIDPRYGTMEDFEELSREAQKRGIKLMLDMVFNHTSSNHEWFQKALAGDERYKNYYIFKKGKEDGSAPTNWESKFGGSAWEYVPEMDEYYLHLFHVKQPDLNWDNPKVRKEVQKVVRFWMSKGVKGLSKEDAFRIIQIHSRDNGRTPMQWNGENHGGFTKGMPWIGVNENYSKINAQSQLHDETSIFNYYKKLVALRKELDIIAYGDIRPLDVRHPSIIAYERIYGEEKMLVVCNFYKTEVVWDSGMDLKGFETLLGNYSEQKIEESKISLKPYEAMMLYRKR